MTEKISRRDFLKLASVGAATTAVLTGCGPASRYVKRSMRACRRRGRSTQPFEYLHALDRVAGEMGPDHRVADELVHA